ncbi:MAG TPA: prepilin-type N-terminal cleavage/methylation domain-containing protein [Candidatus Saccharimonadales bacterium]|jgi:prepilin-type N-terminal cleavage/methylation domain-containing protein|nr:prepilin-type N-terminal cleavage/methylation domain-containing protein [Candidatus Saccharimonadales bacterium]
MLGGKNKQPLGYTIVEVMIVLAISGVMFLIAAQFIQGKQEKTSFTVGVNEMASQIQDVIEQVTNGQYSDIPLKCAGTTTNSVGAQVTFPPGAGTAQGINSSCVFLGKMFRFDVSKDNTQYEIFSLAASRECYNSSRVQQSLTLYCSSFPGYPWPLEGTGVAAIASPYSPVDLTLQETIPQGLEVIHVSWTDSLGSGNIAVSKGSPGFTPAFAFIQSSGSIKTGDTAYQSGGQTIEMVSELDQNAWGPIPASNNITPGNFKLDSQICIGLSDGQQNAEINIGTNNNQLSATVNRLDAGVTPCP